MVVLRMSLRNLFLFQLPCQLAVNALSAASPSSAGGVIRKDTLQMVHESGCHKKQVRVRHIIPMLQKISGIFISLYGLRHHQPVLRAEVGAVDAAQGQRVGAAELVQLRQMSQKLFAGEHGLEALLGADAGDGAAGGDKKQTLPS